MYLRARRRLALAALAALAYLALLWSLASPTWQRPAAVVPATGDRPAPPARAIGIAPIARTGPLPSQLPSPASGSGAGVAAVDDVAPQSSTPAASGGGGGSTAASPSAAPQAAPEQKTIINFDG